MGAAERRLGLKPPGREAQEVPRLSAVRSAIKLPPLILPHMSWTAEVSGPFDLLGNGGPDGVGDCAIAAPAQLARIALAVCGHERRPSEAAVRETYSSFGYKPGHPETDLGVRLTDVLARWKGPGLKLFDTGPLDKILGYISINWRDQYEMNAAIGLFPGLLFGFDMPNFAVSDRPVWSPYLSDLTASDMQPAGGHATACASCGPEGLTQITWGEFRLSTVTFINQYCMEAYAPVMQDWAMPDGLLPSGITRSAAESRIRELAARAR